MNKLHNTTKTDRYIYAHMSEYATFVYRGDFYTNKFKRCDSIHLKSNMIAFCLLTILIQTRKENKSILHNYQK